MSSGVLVLRLSRQGISSRGIDEVIHLYFTSL